MNSKTCTLCIIMAICVICCYYLVVRKISSIPQTKGKIIIVGNAEYSNLGKMIDSYDIVVRINPMDPRSENDAGKKVDVLHINDNINLAKVKPHVKTFLASTRIFWTRKLEAMKSQLDAQNIKYDKIEAYDLKLFRKKYWKEYMSCPKNMTSGLLAIMHALCIYPYVHTAGISAYTRPSFKGRRGSPEFHARNLTTFHCIDAEQELLKRLINEKKVIPID